MTIPKRSKSNTSHDGRWIDAFLSRELRRSNHPISRRIASATCDAAFEELENQQVKKILVFSKNLPLNSER
jgi:hypothetical protein